MRTTNSLRQAMYDGGDGLRYDLAERAITSGDAWLAVDAARKDPKSSGHRHVLMVLSADDQEAAEWIEAGIMTGVFNRETVVQHFDYQNRRQIPRHIVCIWPEDMAIKCVLKQCHDSAALELARRTLDEPNFAVVCILAGNGLMVTRIPLECLRHRGAGLFSANAMHG